MRTVYVDELFLVNSVINFILLLVTKRIIRAKASAPRLLLGSIIGALYAVFMFLPHNRFFYSFAVKLIFSLSLVAITYNIKKMRQYIRAVAVFYMVSFAFGGAAFALSSLTGWRETSYLPLKILATSSVIAYLCIVLLSSYYKRLYVKEKSFVQAEVTFCGETVMLKCFMDTGNSLYDPVSDSPVMVTQYSSVAALLPMEVGECLKSGAVECLPQSFKRRIRLIPYSSVGKSNGFILGFKPDRVVLDGRICHCVVVGLCENALSNDNSYEALANPYLTGGNI